MSVADREPGPGEADGPHDARRGTEPGPSGRHANGPRLHGAGRSRVRNDAHRTVGWWTGTGRSVLLWHYGLTCCHRLQPYSCCLSSNFRPG